MPHLKLRPRDIPVTTGACFSSELYFFAFVNNQRMLCFFALIIIWVVDMLKGDTFDMLKGDTFDMLKGDTFDMLKGIHLIC